MGRVVRRDMVAVRCELRSCTAREVVTPTAIGANWQVQASRLSFLIQRGWALVLTPQLRSYCPVHAQRAVECTCRTNPDRRHLCTVHDEETASLVWSAQPFGSTAFAIAEERAAA